MNQDDEKQQQTVSNTVYAISWSEYERGWGLHPAGYSVHPILQQAQALIDFHTDKTDVHQEEYSWPDTHPFAVALEPGTTVDFKQINGIETLWTRVLPQGTFDRQSIRLLLSIEEA